MAKVAERDGERAQALPTSGRSRARGPARAMIDLHTPGAGRQADMQVCEGRAAWKRKVLLEESRVVPTPLRGGGAPSIGLAEATRERLDATGARSLIESGSVL